MKRITIFDFDGTLTDRDSFIHFAKTAVGISGLIRAGILSIHIIAKWCFGLTDRSKVKEAIFGRMYKGWSNKVFTSVGALFLFLLEDIIRPEMKEKLKEAVENGDEVIIATASIDRWVAPWADFRKVKNVIATRIEIDSENRLTGRFDGANCYGEEKLRRVKEFLAEKFPQLPRDEMYITAYSDSDADAPLLAFADEGIKV